MKKVAALAFLAGLLQALPAAASFSRSDYFDWSATTTVPAQVLGITFSAAEELPAPTLPAEIIPPPATGSLPGSFLYPFERLAENLQLTFTFDAVAKEQFRLGLAQERLEEALTLNQANQPDLAADAAAAYRDTLETVAQNLTTLAQDLTPAVTALLDQTNQTAAQGAVIAQASALTSPPAAAAIWTDIATGAETAMDAAATAANQPAIPDNLSAQLQQLKDQGLITPEQTDKLYGLDDRGQVRDELEQLATSGQVPFTVVSYLDQAVAEQYPEAFTQTQAAQQYAELRSYQSLPQPPDEVLDDLATWENRADSSLPPPETIRPYLYYGRAQDLAEAIDLANFPAERLAELAKFYPEAVTANPSYTPPPLPSPSPSPSPAPETSPTTESSPLPSPTPPLPATVAEPYLGQYSGPLPGSFGYVFKQFGESVRRLTTFNPQARVELNLKLADERLREAAVLAANPDSAAYRSTLANYRSLVADFDGGNMPKEVAQKVEQELARHNAALEKGLLPPPPDEPNTYMAIVRATEDAMDVAAEVLGRPPLPPILSARLQDLKAQGLITPEEVSQLVAADSRFEVRDQLRQLVDSGGFPPAEAKRLDEAQALTSPSDFNQLVEVRKIEELQRLRAIQAEFAQTASLKAATAGLDQQLQLLRQSIDPALIKTENLAGREDLLALHQELAATGSPRPVNGGQFVTDTTATGPTPSDAVLTACPAGAVFKQFTGCVWEGTDRLISDWEQYRCPLPGQYWSFVAKGCVNSTGGDYPTDSQPSCPAGYSWSWQLGSCYVDTSGQLPYPTPQPTPLPPGEEPSCPAGATYKVPRGCVWDDTDRPISDPAQYRREGERQYYSFRQKKCVPAQPDQPMPEEDTNPGCADPTSYYSWSDARCIPRPSPYAPGEETIRYTPPDTSFIRPDSPFYFLDRAWETVQGLTAITPEARQRFRLSVASERLGEAYDLLRRGEEDQFATVLGAYTNSMQQVFNSIGAAPTASTTLGDQLAQAAVRDNAVLQQAAALAPTETTTAISAATSATIQALDRAADLAGEPPLPGELKAKIAALPEGMLTAEQSDALLSADSRVEVRLALAPLTATGVITPTETAFLDQELANIEPTVLVETSQLQALDQLADLTAQKEELETKVEETEAIATKLNEFQQTYTVGGDIPADLRPYIRLTRIDEVAQTVRPDIVRLEDFANRKDVQLAVATLQQEFRPTREAMDRVERFRRNNPNSPLPPELARIEALSFSLGVREAAGPCWLPSPPFAPNTPCPAPGAPIPIASYYSDTTAIGYPGIPAFTPPPTTSEQLTYGQGPAPSSPGVCSDGYHFMYDSGGWCMSNSGNYGPSTPTPGYSDIGGYTPYSPYYTTPGVPPGSYGYQGPGSYYAPSYYTPPSYWGPAPTTYSTTPPPGTVPGTGPVPTALGQCPTGFHWMPPSGNQPGWCMADGGTYVPSSSPGPYPTTSCPSDQYWSAAAGGCIPIGSTPGYYSPNLTQSSCGPGYYWDGRGCIATSPSDRAYTCTYPSGGCPGGYYDWGSCSCRSSSSYTGGSGPSPSNSCQGISCGGGSWLDYSTCSCRYPSSSPGTSTSGSGGYTGGCSYPSGGCGSGWFDWGSCSCRTSSTGTSTPTYSPPPSSTSTSTSSGSCPSGYHWMSDSGGWCMADGGGGGSTTTSSSPAPAPSLSPAPAPSSEPAPSSAPPPPAPPPSEPAPAPPPSEPVPPPPAP